jgi:hypothetical protein
LYFVLGTLVFVRARSIAVVLNKHGFARKVPSAKKIFSRKDAKAQRNPLETR